ncbi:hypothetical protein SLEP1_g24672 [Rubroshorea leprosula]|uniref:Uncharacterized protein n=1 Tax=Rubroshorea leprosula TaxID=152421 RepID=A0AAV5JLQ3_9ROSI|nr:hypothetical protein SLEP1_g24672 [Rubroshorea leprosula]
MKKMKKKSPIVTLKQFIFTVAPLIDVEKETEISASISSWASRNLDGSQRGVPQFSVCSELCVVSFSVTVEIGDDEFPLFLAMQFGTHDVAVLKLNMADSGALGQGVVYWLKDSLITVAFDNIQEEDLNSPLHLEKESNGGWCVNNFGASSCKLENTSFELVITYEAALSLQIASWMALLKETIFNFLQLSTEC